MSFVQKALARLVAVIRRSTFLIDRRDTRQVYAEIVSDVRQRTLRQILIMFELARYRVLLRARPSRWTLSLAGELRWHRNVRLVWWNPMPFGVPILCTDDPRRNTSNKRNSQKIIHLHYYFAPSLDLAPGHFAMPFTMHPQIYGQYREHERLEKHRLATRRMRLLFAGGSLEECYNDPLTGSLFGMLTRHQALEYLQTRNELKKVSSQGELERLLQGEYWNGFVLIAPHFRINQERWLDLISRADFLLCPPAVSPMCHNAVEAMAVGTIPFTNYPEWFSPPLSPRVNCVAFSSADELKSAYDAILRMTDEQIGSLREQVIQYYAEHLDLERCVHRLLEWPERDVHLHVLNPQVVLKGRWK